MPGWGADREPWRRPGVPGEQAPRPAKGAHWREPERQPATVPLLREPTPVFGTAQPARGLSGHLRRAAYAIPERRASHWLVLRLADRLDVVESRGRGEPGRAAALGIGLLAVLWVAGRARRWRGR